MGRRARNEGSAASEIVLRRGSRQPEGDPATPGTPRAPSAGEEPVLEDGLRPVPRRCYVDNDFAYGSEDRVRRSGAPKEYSEKFFLVILEIFQGFQNPRCGMRFVTRANPEGASGRATNGPRDGLPAAAQRKTRARGFRVVLVSQR